jgi:CrcB protein
VILVGVAGAGAVGAVLRYVVDHVTMRRMGSGFPLGILLINVSGSFALGLVTGAATHHLLSATGASIVGTGLVGAYTTFSTFSWDAVNLAERGEWRHASLYIVGVLVPGLLAASAGLALGPHL